MVIRISNEERAESEQFEKGTGMAGLRGFFGR
jgi:hypothetical protein